MSASYFVNYTIVDDNALELDESFQLLLMASPTDSQFTTAGGNHTVVIRDDVTDGGKCYKQINNLCMHVQAYLLWPL